MSNQEETPSNRPVGMYRTPHEKKLTGAKSALGRLLEAWAEEHDLTYLESVQVITAELAIRTSYLRES